MKKFATIAIIALAGSIFLPSCKKEYTCVCTMSGGGVNMTAEAKTGKMSKKDAKAECDKGDVSVAGVTTDCEIK